MGPPFKNIVCHRQNFLFITYCASGSYNAWITMCLWFFFLSSFFLPLVFLWGFLLDAILIMHFFLDARFMLMRLKVVFNLQAGHCGLQIVFTWMRLVILLHSALHNIFSLLQTISIWNSRSACLIHAPESKPSLGFLYASYSCLLLVWVASGLHFLFTFIWCLFYCILTYLQFYIWYQILTDAALLKRQKKEIEELRAKLQVVQAVRPVCYLEMVALICWPTYVF